MPELITKANEAILESHYLRREGRSLRLEATVLARELGRTVIRTRRTERDLADLKTSLDRAFSKP